MIAPLCTLCLPVFSAASVPENRRGRVRLLCAIRHRAGRDICAQARGDGKATEAEKTDEDADKSAVDDGHRVRVVLVIAEVFPHGY